jgi:hypothetical protein
LCPAGELEPVCSAAIARCEGGEPSTWGNASDGRLFHISDVPA